MMQASQVFSCVPTLKAYREPSDRISRYDYIKTRLLSAPLPFGDYRFKDDLACHVASSVLAGTVATSEWAGGRTLSNGH